MKTLFKNYGNKLAAVTDTGDTITYNELFNTADEILKHIKKRCLIFCLCSNTIESLAGYVAFHENGIVPLLLSDGLDEELFSLLVKTYNPEFVWARKDAKQVQGYTDVFHYKGYTLYKTNLKGYDLNNDLALLLTTSGSTGSPKLVRQSYENLIANTESIIEYLNIDDKERPITTLPMNYTYGLSIINTHLYVGAPILLTDRNIIDRKFWDFFRKYNATSFGGVPYTYEMLKRLRFFDMELPSLSTMTQAGGKLIPELHQQFAEYAKKYNKKFIVMYGQTEATARMAYLPADKSLEKCGSMGIAIPNGQFALLDTNDKIITQSGIAGELIYTGKNVTLGYAESGIDLNRGDDRNGILHTGDIAKRDDDGYYYIVGRLKRFLKVFGNRVNLDEIERLIKSEFSIEECACHGKDDKIIIYVVNGEKDCLKKIRTFISHKTKLNINAFSVKTVEYIPKNDSGKVLYSKLEELY